MDQRKRIIIMIAVLLLIAACVCFIPARREIDEDFTCYACHQDDPDYRQAVTVTFRGTYADYLFLPDRFEGYIDVSPFEYLTEDFRPDDAAPLELTLRSDKTDLIAYTISEPSASGKVKTWSAHRGLIRADEDLTALQIGCLVPNPDGGSGWTLDLILSYPDSLNWEDAESALYSDER